MVLVVLIIIAIVLFFSQGQQKSVKKPAFMKKEEIIEGYKTQMQTLIQTHKDNEKQLKEAKMNFLKTANQELNKNIFFTQEEIKKIIYELTLM
jgi:predicted Holliday junction resolvase-like endonuclease